MSKPYLSPELEAELLAKARKNATAANPADAAAGRLELLLLPTLNTFMTEELALGDLTRPDNGRKISPGARAIYALMATFSQTIATVAIDQSHGNTSRLVMDLPWEMGQLLSRDLYHRASIDLIYTLMSSTRTNAATYNAATPTKGAI
jgi:hypothetical protein